MVTGQTLLRHYQNLKQDQFAQTYAPMTNNQEGKRTNRNWLNTEH